ncbi:MAG: hypothetical protein ACJ8AK_12230 [Gemmatimonadaceae bacterium]
MSVSRFWPSALLVVVSLSGAVKAEGQSSYRNLEAGRPVRIEDAVVTERYALDVDLFNLRYDELSDLRSRFLWEPEVAYGVLPRTEMWLRLPVFYRERTSVPRGGLAGLGVGAMYQFNLESEFLPAAALSTELFKPAGPNALPLSYSLKALLTRSFSPGRVHINASVASYAVPAAASLVITCPGTSTFDPNCGGTPLPPLDGPCSVGPAPGASFQCGVAAQEPAASEVAIQPETHAHWLVGLGYDKTIPLSSSLVIADLFAEKFEGIGRKTDMTAEIGLRHQLRPQMVFSSAVGRHFRGAGFSTFLTLGLTLDRALQP